MKAERRPSVTCWTSAEETHIKQFKLFTALCMVKKDCKSTAGIDLGIANKFWRVCTFVNMEFVNNEID